MLWIVLQTATHFAVSRTRARRSTCHSSCHSSGGCPQRYTLGRLVDINFSLCLFTFSLLSSSSLQLFSSHIGALPCLSAAPAPLFFFLCCRSIISSLRLARLSLFRRSLRLCIDHISVSSGFVSGDCVWLPWSSVTSICTRRHSSRLSCASTCLFFQRGRDLSILGLVLHSYWRSW